MPCKVSLEGVLSCTGIFYEETDFVIGLLILLVPKVNRVLFNNIPFLRGDVGPRTCVLPTDIYRRRALVASNC